MFINDLFDLKPTCLFCEEELRTFINVPSLSVSSKIDNNLLEIKSRFACFEIDMITNQVISGTNLGYFLLEIIRDCPNHNPTFSSDMRSYSHKATYSLHQNELKFQQLEQFIFDKEYRLTFDSSVKEMWGVDLSKEQKFFTLPYFNPIKLTKEALLTKISTYLTFL